MKNFTGKIAYYFYLDSEENLGIAKVKLTIRTWDRIHGRYNNDEYEGELLNHIYGPELEDLSNMDVVDMLFTNREMMARIWEWIGR